MLLESNQIAVSGRIVFIPICKCGFCRAEGLSTRSEIIIIIKIPIPPPLFTPTPCQLSSSVHFTPWLQGQNDYELGLAQNLRIWKFSKYFTVRWRLKFLEEQVWKRHKGREVTCKKKKKNYREKPRKKSHFVLHFNFIVQTDCIVNCPFVPCYFTCCSPASSDHPLPFQLGTCKLFHA